MLCQTSFYLEREIHRSKMWKMQNAFKYNILFFLKMKYFSYLKSTLSFVSLHTRVLLLWKCMQVIYDSKGLYSVENVNEDAQCLWHAHNVTIILSDILTHFSKYRFPPRHYGQKFWQSKSLDANVLAWRKMNVIVSWNWPKVWWAFVGLTKIMLNNFLIFFFVNLSVASGWVITTWKFLAMQKGKKLWLKVGRTRVRKLSQRACKIFQRQNHTISYMKTFVRMNRK